MDLMRASRIIAIDEFEHRPRMREQFPDWENRVTYWTVADIDRTAVEQAVAELERLVLERLVAPIMKSR